MSKIANDRIYRLCQIIRVTLNIVTVCEEIWTLVFLF